MTLSVTS